MSLAAAVRDGEFWGRVRADFPILSTEVNGRPLVYLDSAASGQMPQRVIDRIVRYQRSEHANIHRGVHHLSQVATEAYEGAREVVAQFIGARESRECIFVRGATEGINLVMHGFGRQEIGEGDEVLISALEHHSNIVPWQMLCAEKGARLRVIPMSDDGVLDLDAYRELVNDRTRLVAVVHVSNALGTVVDVRQIIEYAHERGVPVLVDGCQAIPHMPVDVRELDADFYVFSGHKAFAATGAGVVYGKAALLERMQPFQGGGDMILNVTFEETTYNVIPHKFEAGTPAIMPVIALSEALSYLTDIGMDTIAAREADLMNYAEQRIREIDSIEILGPQTGRAGVISMKVGDVHPHDVGTILDNSGVAIRAGHHCAQPVMDRLGVPATARASIAFYNNESDIDVLCAALREVKEIFG